MAMKQFVTLTWEDSIPQIKLYNSESTKMEKIDVRGILNIKRHNEKYCKGYYDLIKRTHFPCITFPTSLDSKYSQCKQCEALSGFSQCLGCTGASCKTNSVKALKYCKNPHYVYLAYFEGGIIKVGTAVDFRKHERLLEQGALYSFFIAKTPTGRIARIIEAAIGRQGIASRVAISQKAKNLIITSDVDYIHEQLLYTYNKLVRILDKSCTQYFIEPVVNNFLELSSKVKSLFIEEYEQITLFGTSKELVYKEYEFISHPEKIQGEVMSVIGSLIILREKGQVVVANTKGLTGWMVEIE